MGIVGEIFAGSSANDVLGYFVGHGGSGTPSYLKLETVTDDTYMYLFPDKDGGWRTHNSVPSADTDGVKVIDANDTDALPWTAMANVAILDVNNVTADIATFADSTVYIVNSADGTTVGQVAIICCKVAGNNIDITVEHHVTSDPEVIRLDTAKESLTLVWDGTDWVEVSVTGTVSYP
jgi:hypothetical protein